MTGTDMGGGAPRHVAIIMDGNGRWARKRFLTKKAGHAAGAQALKKLALEAEKLGVEYLTVYAFSTENWSRPQAEIESLMDLIREYVGQYLDDREKNDMRVRVIGRRDRLPEDIVQKISHLEETTRDKPGLCLVIALDYGARDEMTRCIKKICEDVLNGRASVNTINEDAVSSGLDTAGIPDPELVIRTSGELRLSNFLLWQLAYAEFYFTDRLWPDFTARDLKDAFAQYAQRERRFGGRK